MVKRHEIEQAYKQNLRDLGSVSDDVREDLGYSTPEEAAAIARDLQDTPPPANLKNEGVPVEEGDWKLTDEEKALGKIGVAGLKEALRKQRPGPMEKLAIGIDLPGVSISRRPKDSKDK